LVLFPNLHIYPDSGARRTPCHFSMSRGIVAAMNTKTLSCPNCGQSTTGQFCSHCGTSLTGALTPVTKNVQKILPWIAIGISIIALVVALAALFNRGSNAVSPIPARFSQSLSTPLSETGQPPDLSSMTPREAADRLFNRVMAASENGNNAEVSQFTPMALQAYHNLGTLDNDARYHVALLHLSANNSQSAQAQIDLLRKSEP